MERIIEARRHDAAAGSGLPSRRRYRTASLRDSPDGPTELPETMRLRDRAIRRERDRDLLDRNQLRRVERFVRTSNTEGGGEESTEECIGGAEDDETEKKGSHSNHSHNQRKSSLSARVARTIAPPESTAVDEIVDVTVPRKARSSFVKRSHEYMVSGNVSSRRSGDSISPANSNLSSVKKMKETPNDSKSSGESQGNIEIEIAEVLYGLMKQSQSSKKESFPPNSSQKLESNHSNAVVESEQPRKSEAPFPNLSGEKCEVSVQVSSLSMAIQKEVAAHENSRRTTIESGRGDGIGSFETIVMEKEDSPSSSKLNNDLQDLKMTEGTSLGDKIQQEKINSDTKNKETLVMEKVEEIKMKPTQEKRKWLTFDLETEDRDQTQDDANLSSRILKQDQKQQKQTESIIHKKKKNVLSSSSSLTNNLPRWANNLPSLGSTTAMSIDGNTGTSKALQAPHFPLSQPRTKRCKTHHHIAWNIYMHKQFVDMNKFKQAPACSASVYDTTSCNLSLMLPPNPSPADVSSTHEDKIYGAAATNSSDNVHGKQLVFQQAPQPATVSNLQHGSASTQSGILKSINNASSPSSSSAAIGPPASMLLPTGAATMSFSYPIMPANDAACLAMLPNRYPIPISSPFGTVPAFIGSSPGQPTPYFNGTFYSPHVFHPQQPHSQNTVLPASSGSSSSSHKNLHPQKPHGSQIKANNFPTSNGTMQTSKGGVELVPQAFTMSFASSNGNAVAPNINFSSMPQNPALFHNLPHAAKQNYQAVAAGQMAQERHYQTPAGKGGKESKAAGSGFDNSARTLNFMSPPVIGNWHSAFPVSANSPLSQQQPASVSTKFQVNSPNPNQNQQQQRHLQKQHVNNAPIFLQKNVFGGQSQSQSPQCKMSSARSSASNMASLSQNQNSPRASTSNMAPSSQNPNVARISVSNMAPSSQNQSSARNYVLNMVSTGQNQISFAGATTSVSKPPPQDGNGNSRMASTGSTKAGSSAPALQQIDNAATNRSSPVCGRNVLSILMSSPPNHLSELKH